MVLILVIDNMVLLDGVQIGLQTAMGQMLDLITTHTGAKDLARYRIQGYVIRALFFSKFDKLIQIPVLQVSPYCQVQDILLFLLPAGESAPGTAHPLSP
jgi:hypothetical protein